MELFLSANAAITLTLLVLQMLDCIEEGRRMPSTEGHRSAFLGGLPRAVANPEAEPAVRYGRAA
jgi:hypothetical protein